MKAGTTYGATDEFGLDHHRLSTKFQGFDVRLTGIAGEVISGVMA